MLTFIIADDHPITLAGMKSYIEKLGHTVLATYENGMYAYNNIISLKPDFAILDLSMPSMNGLEILEKVRLHNKTIKIIIYTMYHENSLFEKAKSLGVNGYILKDFAMQELNICIESLIRKQQWFSPKLNDTLTFKDSDENKKKLLILTPSERKIMSLIADEKNSKQIAELLFITEKTVENHRSHIIKKLQLPSSKNALLIWALEHKASILNTTESK
jgi:DNA-binding NarL/FixJ family response regulator